MTTLSNFRTGVRDRLAVSDNDTFLTDTRLADFINQAIRQITLEHDWPWLQKTTTIQTVAGVSEYDLPDDFLRMGSLVQVGSNRELEYQPVQQADRWISEGNPLVFSIYGGKLLLKPTPNGELEFQLRYICYEPELVSGSDVALIPDYWDDGVLEFSVYLAARSIKRFDEAELALAAYREWLARGRDNTRQVKSPNRVVPRPGGWF